MRLVGLCEVVCVGENIPSGCGGVDRLGTETEKDGV